MEELIVLRKRTARFAGVLYLLLAISGFYGIMYVPRLVIVKGDAVTTAANMIKYEFLFRTGIAVHLVSVLLILCLAIVLYRLFKPVNSALAQLLVSLVVVQVPIIFLIETCRFTALMVIKGEVLKALTPEQAQDLAMVFLKVHGYGIMTVEIFWGLWLIPFGLLVYKSGFIPVFLGILLVMAGIGYTLDSFTFILYPNYRPFTMPVAFTLSGIGEVSTICWLLIKGTKSTAN